MSRSTLPLAWRPKLQPARLTEYNKKQRWIMQLKQTHTHLSLILGPQSHLGSLYIGNVVCLLKPQLLTSHHISAILTCSGETFLQGPRSCLIKHTLQSLNITHKLISASDTENYHIGQHFKECSEFIRENRAQGRNVLVHCHAGKSRSASIVIAYMMEDMGVPVEDAYRLAKQKRPIVHPNQGFWAQLQQYDQFLRGRRTDKCNQNHNPNPLYFSEVYTVQKRLSLPVRQLAGGLSERSLNLTQSLVEDRTYEQPKQPTLMKAVSNQQQPSTSSANFKKIKRIKQLDEGEVNDIKANIRKYLEGRKVE